MTAAVVLVLVLGTLLVVVFRATRHPDDMSDPGRCYCGRRRPVLPAPGPAHRAGPVHYGGCDHGGGFRAPVDQVCVHCECVIPAGEPAAYTLTGEPVHAPDCPRKVRIRA